jgi:hypothetical protein
VFFILEISFGLRKNSRRIISHSLRCCNGESCFYYCLSVCCDSCPAASTQSRQATEGEFAGSVIRVLHWSRYCI